jgi:hypothetical protein
MAIKLNETFLCRGEDGRTYTVMSYEDFISTMSDPHGTFPGMKTLRLSDGREVKHSDHGTFRIVCTGTILRRL